MIKKYMIILINTVFFMSVFSSVGVAGSANLTIINDNPDLAVTRYVVRYWQANNLNVTPQETDVQLQTPAKGSSQCLVSVDGAGEFCFSVKDIYDNGSESDFSEVSFPIFVPNKVDNIQLIN